MNDTIKQFWKCTRCFEIICEVSEEHKNNSARYGTEMPDIRTNPIDFALRQDEPERKKMMEHAKTHKEQHTMFKKAYFRCPPKCLHETPPDKQLADQCVETFREFIARMEREGKKRGLDYDYGEVETKSEK